METRLSLGGKAIVNSGSKVRKKKYKKGQIYESENQKGSGRVGRTD